MNFNDEMLKLYGSLYEHNLLDLIEANGFLSTEDDNERINIKIHLFVDLKGDCFGFMETTDFLQAPIINGPFFNTFSLQCENDDFRITCDKISLNNESFTIGVGQEAMTSYTFDFLNELLIWKKEVPLDIPLSISCLMRNFPVERHWLPLNIHGIDVNISAHPKYLMSKKLIKQNILHYGILSVANYKCISLEEIEVKIDPIEWLISLLCSNACFSPLQILYNDENEIIGYRLCNRISKAYRNNKSISPHNHKIFIEQASSSQNFQDYYDEFKILISIMIEFGSITSLEILWAELILGFEYLLTMILKNEDTLSIDQIEGMNIQAKLSRVNRNMRFIDSRLLNDYLRDRIRNPLFHTGVIPNISLSEHISELNNYIDLFHRILFRYLGYNGSYISKSNDFSEAPV